MHTYYKTVITELNWCQLDLIYTYTQRPKCFKFFSDPIRIGRPFPLPGKTNMCRGSMFAFS